MNDVFLSYHWRDRERIEVIAEVLSAEYKLSVFLDRWYLVPGQPWPQALENAMKSCRAAVVCVGAGEMGPWQIREMNLALERQAREPGFPVIPVLLPGADPSLGFLTQNTWIDLRAAPVDRNALSSLSAAIRRESPGSSCAVPWKTSGRDVCPYRGLLYFREEDAPFYFGREVATKRLCATVARSAMTAVVGSSGSGKSSLVRAGLVSVLRRDRERPWEVVTIVPGDRPLHALAASLLSLLHARDSFPNLLFPVDALANDLADGRTRLSDVIVRYLGQHSDVKRVLLVVDQWEELYTSTDGALIRERFVGQLLDAMDHVGGDDVVQPQHQDDRLRREIDGLMGITARQSEESLAACERVVTTRMFRSSV